MSQVAVIQMVSGADTVANLRNAEVLLRQGAEQGAKLMVLPENFATMGRRDLASVAAAEAGDEGMIVPWLKRICRELDIWLVAGTLPLLPEGATSGKPCAASLLIDSDGEVVARYDKIHLFDVDVADQHGSYRESDDYAHGDRVVVAQTPVGRVGLSVCYDLRFAELYLQLAAAGAELICIPSAFTAVTGAAHWQVLTRARAIETQCYVLAPNQGGVHSANRHTFGHSAIIDPWGQVLNEQHQGSGVLLAEIDLAAQQAMRQRMPVATHRRLS
ncbi:carbon-nitrogen hydrolase family protein [Atopomonas sediminilitoris]|uniref:carbon-nitrogen hydrolase family protein n=1 Tax=Atopomonas sediminilitoris TaxID=2919919 RepID=UPI001F4D7D87|nr:carbon-nitrogen hydrolase family protein [Atopomonas sediminilitoris]MCJ8169975.1 carbon-nitrogen hydrolase family protein [Atopomonas sediminilitoris]